MKEQSPVLSSKTAKERVINPNDFRTLAFARPLAAKPGCKSITVEATGDPALDRQRLIPYKNLEAMFGGVEFEELGDGCVNVQVPIEASDAFTAWAQKEGLSRLESVRNEKIGNAKTINTLSVETEQYTEETIKNMGRNLPADREKEPLPPLAKGV